MRETVAEGAIAVSFSSRFGSDGRGRRDCTADSWLELPELLGGRDCRRLRPSPSRPTRGAVL